MDLRIIRAKSGDAAVLTALAHDAKRHWGYPEELITLWSDGLTFTPEYIDQHVVFVAKQSERVVGVYALVPSGNELELEHLWVGPDMIGHGVGRALLDHAGSTARASGAKKLKIISDPNAEGFYSKMGALRLGEVPSLPMGRSLPLLYLQV
jgi:GNAT superfamily N-acetyltransferase